MKFRGLKMAAVTAFAIGSWSVVCAGPLEIFGYFESEFDYQRLGDRDYTMQYNKLRIDFQKRLDDHVFFGANVDYINYNGATEYNMLDMAPFVPVDIDSEDYPYYLFSFEDTVFVDNAFVQLSTSAFDLTLGRQQLSFGAGYAWNPTDIFNMKKLLDPTYEQPGHNALRADIPIGKTGNLLAVYSTGDDWENSKYFTRGKWRMGHFDLGISYGRTWSEGTDFVSDGFPAWNEQRLLYGGEFSGEILGLGCWGEAAWNNMESIDNYFEGLVGCDYTFSFQTYVLAEFYHNGYSAPPLGVVSGNEYSFNQWMRLIAGEVKTLAHNYMFVFVEHPAHDLVNAGLFSITNFNDRSIMLNPQVTWYPYQDVEFTSIVNIGIGSGGSEFGSFDPAGLIRLRVSF